MHVRVRLPGRDSQRPSLLVKNGSFESEDNMNRLLCMASLLLMILPMVAQAPKGIVVWKSADLKAYAATLAPKMNAQKIASQALADFGAYNTMVAHREGSADAEWHDNAADFMVIQSGGCTLILGGTIKDSHTDRKSVV